MRPSQASSAPAAADSLKFAFAPVVDQATRLLILGSLPGEVSLQRGEYYANRQNQFWRLMEAVTGVGLGDPYEQRLQRLLAAGVGLWDVVASATRIGSLDAAIRGHRANALAELAAGLPSLRAVAFNGAKASAIGRLQFADQHDLTLITLPSSSPAYTAPFERKLAAWRQLRAFLSS